ncbi:MAG: 5-formyltetrahydrofolate cyclo-ligase, partial [Cyanobacteria bacterium J083]
MNQTDKEQLRRKILKNRQSLSKSQWQAKSNSICENLQNSSLYRQAKTILAYFSFRQEANLNPLWQDNKTWGFPRCVNDNLQWHFWQQGEPLENNKYGISEPLATSPIISPQQVDLILIPTVACDYQKYRLGYG